MKKLSRVFYRFLFEGLSMTLTVVKIAHFDPANPYNEFWHSRGCLLSSELFSLATKIAKYPPATKCRKFSADIFSLVDEPDSLWT